MTSPLPTPSTGHSRLISSSGSSYSSNYSVDTHQNSNAMNQRPTSPLQMTGQSIPLASSPSPSHSSGEGSDGSGSGSGKSGRNLGRRLKRLSWKMGRSNKDKQSTKGESNVIPSVSTSVSVMKPELNRASTSRATTPTIPVLLEDELGETIIPRRSSSIIRKKRVSYHEASEGSEMVRREDDGSVGLMAELGSAQSQGKRKSLVMMSLEEEKGSPPLRTITSPVTSNPTNLAASLPSSTPASAELSPRPDENQLHREVAVVGLKTGEVALVSPTKGEGFGGKGREKGGGHDGKLLGLKRKQGITGRRTGSWDSFLISPTQSSYGVPTRPKFIRKRSKSLPAEWDERAEERKLTLDKLEKASETGLIGEEDELASIVSHYSDTLAHQQVEINPTRMTPPMEVPSIVQPDACGGSNVMERQDSASSFYPDTPEETRGGLRVVNVSESESESPPSAPSAFVDPSATKQIPLKTTSRPAVVSRSNNNHRQGEHTGFEARRGSDRSSASDLEEGLQRNFELLGKLGKMETADGEGVPLLEEDMATPREGSHFLPPGKSGGGSEKVGVDTSNEMMKELEGLVDEAISIGHGHHREMEMGGLSKDNSFENTMINDPSAGKSKSSSPGGSISRSTTVSISDSPPKGPKKQRPLSETTINRQLSERFKSRESLHSGKHYRGSDAASKSPSRQSSKAQTPSIEPRSPLASPPSNRYSLPVLSSYPNAHSANTTTQAEEDYYVQQLKMSRLLTRNRPLPRAMDYSEVNKLRSSVERAATYRRLMEELGREESGLEWWLGRWNGRYSRGGNRPNHSPNSSVPSLPSHPSNKTLHHSHSRDFSIVSEFPMRGDGGKATDITFRGPAPGILPDSGVPYPGVLTQPRGVGSNIRGYAMGGAKSGMGFLGTLGRKGSKMVGSVTASTTMGGVGAVRSPTIPSSTIGLGRDRDSLKDPGKISGGPRMPNSLSFNQITPDPLPVSMSANNNFIPPLTNSASSEDSHQLQTPIASQFSIQGRSKSFTVSSVKTQHTPSLSHSQSRSNPSTLGPSSVNPIFEEKLQIVMDILPHVERDVLKGYMVRAAGDDVKAISMYLEDERAGRIRS